MTTTGASSTTRTAAGPNVAALGAGVIVGVTASIWIANGALTQLTEPAGGWLLVGQFAGMLAALASLAGCCS